MNLTSQRKKRSRFHKLTGFTLVEMMMVVVIFAMMIAAIIAIQIFAMRVYTLSATKLTATTDARETLNFMRDQIRKAKLVYVGTYAPNGSTGFIQATNGTLQKGNAIAMGFSDKGNTNYLVYYLDNANPTNILYSITNNVKTVMAKYVTNYYCFYAEDYTGSNVVNYQNNPVIRIILQFDQWEYPIGFIGTNALNAYDYYQLTARVTRRAKN
jgi:prepilin-type N-terminal cleavage/methylation domain-containing protein